MTKNSISQSQKRFNESVAKLFDSERTGPLTLFLTSSSDQGVIRNGGRNGSRFAPQSLLSTLKKFTLTEEMANLAFREVEVSDQLLELVDFKKAQEEEARKIYDQIRNHPKSPLYHIGGGHDHVYPLLKALSHIYPKIIVINIDAHADTRTDDDPNSGTPFRQFCVERGENFSLLQIGLNPFANSFSTLSNLECSTQKIIWRKELTKEKVSEQLKTIRNLIDEKTAVIFSIDADALSGSEVPGVSAVNPNGISLQELQEIWTAFRGIGIHHPAVVGIYELNPIYDSISSISMKTLATFIFESL
jgi:formiminoglutamase